jgi:hypothetical protein
MLTVSTTSCAKVYAEPDDPPPAVNGHEGPPAAAFDGLAARIAKATDDAAARATITQAVKKMFPSVRVGA